MFTNSPTFDLILAFIFYRLYRLEHPKGNGTKSLRQYNNCYYKGKFKNQDCTQCPYREYCLKEDDE